MDSVTVVVPTLGRETLWATLASIPDEWQTIVVADGPDALARVQEKAVDEFVVATPANSGCLGHPQRNLGDLLADTDWLLHLDDDDAYVPNVREIVGANVKERRPHIFQMRYPEGTVLWQNPELRKGTVGTPMFVVPNVKGGLGRWPSKQCGDWDFISLTCQLQGDPVFVPEVIALVRPHEA